MYMMYGVVILVGVVFIGLFVAQAVIFSGNGRIAAAEEYLTSHTSVWEDKAGEYTLSFTASGENGVFRSKDGEREFSVSFGIPGTMHFKGPSARNDDEALSAHWRMDKEKESVTLIWDCEPWPEYPEYKGLYGSEIVLYEQKAG